MLLLHVEKVLQWKLLVYKCTIVYRFQWQEFNAGIFLFLKREEQEKMLNVGPLYSWREKQVFMFLRLV